MSALTTSSPALSLVLKIIGGGDCWYGLGVEWVLGLEGVGVEMGGVTNGKVLAFSGVEVQVPIPGPAGTGVSGVLENIMAVSGGD